MAPPTLTIDGRKFRVIPEEEYQSMRALAREQLRQAEEDAEDARIAIRRLKNPKMKTIPLAQLRAELGL